MKRVLPTLSFLRRGKRKRPLRPFLLGALTFAAGAFAGALLLSTPWASSERVWTPFVDCLFTSTSAICVTGLIVVDTGSYWSPFGQMVILALIQLGGIGIMTFSAFVAILLGRRMTFRAHSALGTMLGEDAVNMGRVVRHIVGLTLSAEALGAALLWFSWHRDPLQGGGGHAAYSAIFHSISGFCNAGFSLYRDSLTRYRASPSVNLIMMGLIILGGLGFPVVRNLWERLRGKDGFTGIRPKLSVQTKLVLSTSGTLILVGTLLVLMLEWNAPSMEGLPGHQKVIVSLFQSVTPRTAGFNTLDIGLLMPATAFLTIVLMFIGGSPGSTAGGIKTTTFCIMLATLRSTLRGRRHVEVYAHTLPLQVIRRTIIAMFLGLTVVTFGFFLLLITEEAPFLDTLFETVSAFGTVGLSRGLTPDLTVTGRLIITAIMFIGRLGPLTLLMAVGSLDDHAEYKYPDARVVVG